MLTLLPNNVGKKSVNSGPMIGSWQYERSLSQYRILNNSGIWIPTVLVPFDHWKKLVFTFLNNLFQIESRKPRDLVGSKAVHLLPAARPDLSKTTMTSHTWRHSVTQASQSTKASTISSFRRRIATKNWIVRSVILTCSCLMMMWPWFMFEKLDQSLETGDIEDLEIPSSIYLPGEIKLLP